jgi:hypothetical protein
MANAMIALIDKYPEITHLADDIKLAVSIIIPSSE